MPIAITIAANPPAVIAVVLMLSAEPSGRRASAFVAGWLVGLAAVAAAAIALGDAVGFDSDGSMTATAVKALIGVGLLGLAAKKWFGRSANGDVEHMPGWMSSITQMTAARSFGFAALFAALNPKSLALNIAGALLISELFTGIAAEAVALVVFVLASSITLLVPLAYVKVAPAQSQGVLGAFQRWLITNSDTITAVVLAVLGIMVSVSAAEQFFSLRAAGL